ncbi:hypothetical protein LAZ67_1005246, partial [Cordylochernes scorpioides]
MLGPKTILAKRKCYPYDKVYVTRYQEDRTKEDVTRQLCVRAVPPVIEPFRLPASVHMGQRLSITCTVVRGDPPISLRWERDGEPLGDPGDLRVHDMADFSSTLLFPAVAPGHRATYTCVAQNAAGRTLHSAAMVIHGRTPFFFSPYLHSGGPYTKYCAVPPSWKIEPRDVDVVRGRSIAIDCQAEGFPAPRLVWRKALGKLRPFNFLKSLFSLSHC